LFIGRVKRLVSPRKTTFIAVCSSQHGYAQVLIITIPLFFIISKYLGCLLLLFGKLIPIKVFGRRLAISVPNLPIEAEKASVKKRS
jgi:surface polysaccharide O-acyltransferase-like enzyme